MWLSRCCIRACVVQYFFPTHPRGSAFPRPRRIVARIGVNEDPFLQTSFLSFPPATLQVVISDLLPYPYVSTLQVVITLSRRLAPELLFWGFFLPMVQSGSPQILILPIAESSVCSPQNIVTTFPKVFH